MLVALVVVFFLMWGPTFLMNIIRNFHGRFLVFDNFLVNKLETGFVALSFLNSSVNPILLPLTSRPVLPFQSFIELKIQLTILFYKPMARVFIPLSLKCS